MSTSYRPADLEKLAKTLTEEGPCKFHSASPRKIRVVFNNEIIVDTTDAFYVWEHPYYPQLYVPTSSIKCHLRSLGSVQGSKGNVSFDELIVGERKTDRVFSLASYKDPSDLEGMTRLDFETMDAWYEEDAQILVHPKDIFKRVDVIPSSRSIDVSVDDIFLAKATFSMHLYETLLPARYYLPKTSVKQQYLRPSKTRTQCPYKGEAEYYDIVLDVEGEEKVYKDLVWYYNYPNVECAGIKGMLCFYNEKIDLWVGGVKEERPQSKFG